MNALRNLLGLSLAAIALVAVAQNVDTTSPPRQGASVVVANRVVTVLRAPIAGYSAQERVNATRQRVETILDADDSPVVSTEDVEDGTQVLLDGKLAFLVTRVDIEPQAGETTRNVAREGARRLEGALAEYRQQHTPAYLLAQSGWVALASAIYLGLLWLLLAVGRWAGHRVTLAVGARAEKCTCKA